MVTGFWEKIKKPIMALAPMSNVTDCAFRRMIIKYSRYGGTNINFDQASLPAEAERVGGPDVTWTEFVSCDGLMSKGREKLLIDLRYTEKERPIVAQIFGSKPENFYQTALLLQELGFDGIDINMGCPDRHVEKQGAGARLMKNPELARKIILETKRGAESAGRRMAVSVKTRIGYDKNELATWLPALLDTEPAAIIIHCRTRKEMSDVPARWEHIAEAVKIRDAYDNSANKTLILGNGDVTSLAQTGERCKKTGADGVMIGRGIFGNPWFFNKKIKPESITPEMKLKVMIEHTYLFEKLLTGHKNFDIMKKHYKAYVNGWPGAKELRIKLMASTKDAATVERVVRQQFPNL